MSSSSSLASALFSVRRLLPGTDQGGHIVTGNAVGDVRLYDGGVNADGKYKRAKTHLKGLGDPLLHVCALSDGSWVLGKLARPVLSSFSL